MLFEPAHRMMSIAPVHRDDAHAGDPVDHEERPRPGIAAAVLTWMQQGICGLHGHDPLLHWNRNRLYLRCASCGHETPGWDVGRRPAAPRPETLAQVSGDLAVARKIA